MRSASSISSSLKIIFALHSNTERNWNFVFENEKLARAHHTFIEISDFKSAGGK